MVETETLYVWECQVVGCPLARTISGGSLVSGPEHPQRDHPNPSMVSSDFTKLLKIQQQWHDGNNPIVLGEILQNTSCLASQSSPITQLHIHTAYLK